MITKSHRKAMLQRSILETQTSLLSSSDTEKCQTQELKWTLWKTENLLLIKQSLKEYHLGMKTLFTFTNLFGPQAICPRSKRRRDHEPDIAYNSGFTSELQLVLGASKNIQVPRASYSEIKLQVQAKVLFLKK